MKQPMKVKMKIKADIRVSGVAHNCNVPPISRAESFNSPYSHGACQRARALLPNTTYGARCCVKHVARTVRAGAYNAVHGARAAAYNTGYARCALLRTTRCTGHAAAYHAVQGTRGSFLHCTRSCLTHCAAGAGLRSVVYGHGSHGAGMRRTS